MSFEVEVKYRAVDHDQLRQTAGADWRPLPAAVVEHEDIYLNHPARDFAPDE